MSTRRTWAFGCALVMVASIALGWVLGASPLLDTARVADEARESAEAQNAAYTQELAILKEQFTGIDDLKDQLGELREEIPDGANLPAYLGQLSTDAQKHAVALATITVADAVAYAPTAAEAPVVEAPPADAEAPEGAAALAAPAPVAEGAGVPVTSPLVTAENFVTIPITLALKGDYDNVLAFVESLQKGTRLTSVTAFSTTKEGAEAAVAPVDGEGAVATSATANTVTGTVTLYIYVLLDPAAE
jgi:Tfp pilus assembly protein PilO